MLALCCGEIERYFFKVRQPTHTCPAVHPKQENRVTVADDRAGCDTLKKLCIVLILPLAALRITYGEGYWQMRVLIQHSNEIAFRNKILESSRTQ